MQHQKHGRLLFLALAFALSSCRKDNPPPIETCTLDGFGGGDCVEPGGAQKYRTPSEMSGFFATNPKDEAGYISWCYGANKTESAQIYSLIQDHAGK